MTHSPKRFSSQDTPFLILTRKDRHVWHDHHNASQYKCVYKSIEVAFFFIILKCSKIQPLDIYGNFLKTNLYTPSPHLQFAFTHAHTIAITILFQKDILLKKTFFYMHICVPCTHTPLCKN